MSKKTTSVWKGRMAVGVAGAALVLSLPTAGFAVGLLESSDATSSLDSFATFTPASADPRLAEMMEARTGGNARMIRFTPAGIGENANRAVTVAVRVDEEAAQAISVHSAIRSAREPVAAEASTHIAPTRYNLGLARGYSSFAQAQAQTLAPALSDTKIPDLTQFEPTPGVREEESRFAARIEFEEERPAARSGRQTLDSVGDQSLDVAGSYRLTRNLDVTAGVRYRQDRDRLTSLPNIEQQDSQAVYVGTQFRF